MTSFITEPCSLPDDLSKHDCLDRILAASFHEDSIVWPASQNGSLATRGSNSTIIDAVHWFRNWIQSQVFGHERGAGEFTPWPRQLQCNWNHSPSSKKNNRISLVPWERGQRGLPTCGQSNLCLYNLSTNSYRYYLPFTRIKSVRSGQPSTFLDRCYGCKFFRHAILLVWFRCIDTFI